MNAFSARKLAVILFADIQGYTAIMQVDEAKGMQILKAYQTCLESEVGKFQGEIVKNYGDGSLCIFNSVYGAISCAKNLQLRLQQDPKVPLRVGLHLGDVTYIDNDVYGDAINIASRIESMAVPGSVLLSKGIYDKVKNQPSLEMRSLGHFDFKNIEEPLEVYALINEGIVDPIRSQLKGKFKSTSSNTTSTKKNYLFFILGLLMLAAGWFFFNSKHDSKTDIQKHSSNTQQEKAIAVLVFSDMSPEQDQKYFSEGISEEIINLLTKIPNLKVISKTSSFALKDKNISPTEIGSTLNVNHILDGSIRKSGNKIRISTQLIESKEGTQLWSETYDRDLDDIFKIQDEIANEIIQQLEVNFLGKSIKSKIVDLEAFNLYLETKLLRSQRNATSDSLAEVTIRESIKIDDTYAPSWAQLSELIFNGAFSNSSYSIPEAMSLSREAAQKSVELDPQNALGYIALSSINRAESDFITANKNLTKALELEPDNVDVIYESASNALDLGNMEEAIVQIKKAIRLDPLNYLLQYTLGLYLMWIEDYDGAEVAMAKYLKINPNSGLANNFMSQIYLKQGKIDKAHKTIEKDTDPFWSLYRKSIISYATGDYEKADALLKEFETSYGNEAWPNIAHVYACRGDKEQTFKWLYLSIKNKDASMMEILNYPEFKFIHNDPQWYEIIGKLKLPPNHGFFNK